MTNPAVELSVIVPTLNERECIPELVRRLRDALSSHAWEVIFVDDDSSDGTADTVRQASQQDSRVRCLQRLDRRGLSSAVIEGMLSSSAPYLAVMDADLQHDERLLPEMLGVLRNESVDVVVGSRYARGDYLSGFTRFLARIRRLAIPFRRLLAPSDLRDPLSGFFMIRRDVLDQTVRRTSGIGFKILLDLFASSPRPLRFKELPYESRSRYAGTSKLDGQSMAIWDYGMLLLDKLVGRVIPARFISFVAVGSFGVIVHMGTLALLFNQLELPFVVGQTAAAIAAMTSNFTLNNIITYRDQRLRGWDWLKGWVSFNIACGIGAIANIGVAQFLFARDTIWFLAGLAGIIVGAVWNYVITRIYTWHSATR